MFGGFFFFWAFFLFCFFVCFKFCRNCLEYISHMISYHDLKLSLFLYNRDHAGQGFDFFLCLSGCIFQNQTESGRAPLCTGNIVCTACKTNDIMFQLLIIFYCFCHFSLSFSLRIQSCLVSFPDSKISVFHPIGISHF